MMKKATPKKKSWSGRNPRLSIILGIVLIILGIAISDSDLLNTSNSIANDYEEDVWDDEEALNYIDQVKNWNRGIYEDIQVATTNVEYDEDNEVSLETYSDGDSYTELVETVGAPTRTYTNKSTSTEPSIVEATWEEDLDDGDYISIYIRYEKDSGQIISKDCYGSF